MNISGVTVAAVVAASLVGAGSASASSIVSIKSGNVFLSSPDARTGYQVTSDGGWSSPSEADDGTIMAVKGDQLYRMTPSGRLLGPAVDTVYSGGGPFHGPFDARVSPDGRNVAFWGGYDETGTWDGYNWWQLDVSTLWGSSSAFGTPNQVLGQQDYTMPSWLDDGRLLMSNINAALIEQVAVYALGGGDNSEVQWFSDPGAPSLENGVASRDGSKLAFAAGDASGATTQIRLYSAQGIPSGNPSDPLPPAPTPRCAINASRANYPSFSPDGRSLVWQGPDGVHEADAGTLGDCSALGDHLLIAGAQQPFWGVADVNMANQPGSAGGGATGGGATGGGGATPSGGTHGGSPAPGTSTTIRPVGAACVVPALRHLTVRQARGALRHAHCRLGHVRIGARGHRHHVLRVSRQSARPGSTHTAQYAVGVSVR